MSLLTSTRQKSHKPCFSSTGWFGSEICEQQGEGEGGRGGGEEAAGGGGGGEEEAGGGEDGLEEDGAEDLHDEVGVDLHDEVDDMHCLAVCKSAESKAFCSVHNIYYKMWYNVVLIFKI